MDPSQSNGQDRLKVMVVEDNPYMLGILNNALRHLGFSQIMQAKNGEEAIAKLRTSDRDRTMGARADLIISDLIMSPVNGMMLLQWIRNDPHSPSRFTPFVMLSGAADREYVEMARDYGVTEFLAKPFSVAAVYSQLQRIIDYPRQFVMTQRFFGPDRRRKKAGADYKNERRREGERHATVIYSEGTKKKADKFTDVYLFKLPNTLRGKMGAKPGESFKIHENLLDEAEETLEHDAKGFIDWAAGYLRQLSTLVKEAREKGISARGPEFERINLVAHEIRGQGGTFGYPLMSILAKSLYELTRDDCPMNNANLEICIAHIDAMRAVIRDKVGGDGGEIGRAVVKSISEAIKKHGGKKAFSTGESRVRTAAEIPTG